MSNMIPTRADVMIALWLYITLFAIAAYDIFCVATGQADRTVSAVLYRWNRESPFVAITIGVILGHLFWPQRA